jgi:hypothetical protein
MKIIESFTFIKDNVNYFAIVTEKLGFSLYDYIKMNHYYGFPLKNIQIFAKEILEGVNFLHKNGFIDSDLKPENILFSNNDYTLITSDDKLPLNVIKKDLIYKNKKSKDKKSLFLNDLNNNNDNNIDNNDMNKNINHNNFFNNNNNNHYTNLNPNNNINTNNTLNNNNHNPNNNINTNNTLNNNNHNPNNNINTNNPLNNNNHNPNNNINTNNPFNNNNHYINLNHNNNINTNNPLNNNNHYINLNPNNNINTNHTYNTPISENFINNHITTTRTLNPLTSPLEKNLNNKNHITSYQNNITPNITKPSLSNLNNESDENKSMKNMIESNPKKSIKKQSLFSNEKPYYIPSIKNNPLKIIDFGGVLSKNDKISDVINTRQYRAPEDILQCSLWDEKSDIWSIGCIIYELYTGEVLFPTHDDQEHLCMIEKICGKFPEWMILNSFSSFRKIFNLNKNSINYNCLHKKYNVCKNVDKVVKIENGVFEEHYFFKEFLMFLLQVDPKKRPTGEEALKHKFFSIEILE